MEPMGKEEQIAEMAIQGCRRTPQAWTLENCAECEFKAGHCLSYVIAEKIYNAGYRKSFEEYKTGFQDGFNAAMLIEKETTATKETAEQYEAEKKKFIEECRKNDEDKSRNRRVR